jgi:hypothetical protein
MTLDAAAVAWLLTPEGTRATEVARDALASGVSTLTMVERLRKEHAPEHARAALALLEGRASAAGKFEDADRLYFDRESAEQATSALVARHTARRFRTATRVVDLGCGAGADTLAIAEFAPVFAVDRDPGRVALTAANAAVRRLAGRVETTEGDASDTGLVLPSDIDAVWLDPARRDESGRRLDPEAWSPPLSRAITIASRFRMAGIKVAPGIEHDVVPAAAEVEFISLDGRLVEAVIWLGEAVTTPRRTTALPSGVTIEGEPDNGGTPLGMPGAFLYDLDPGVGRASLVDVLAPELDAWLMESGIAYLTGDTAQESPFARRFRILAAIRFSERRVMDVLRDAGAGRVDVMRRGSPVETNALEVRLNRELTGEGRALTVALTRVDGQHTAIVCERER